MLHQVTQTLASISAPHGQEAEFFLPQAVPERQRFYAGIIHRALDHETELACVGCICTPSYPHLCPLPAHPLHPTAPLRHAETLTPIALLPHLSDM